MSVSSIQPPNYDSVPKTRNHPKILIVAHLTNCRAAADQELIKLPSQLKPGKYLQVS